MAQFDLLPTEIVSLIVQKIYQGEHPFICDETRPLLEELTISKATRITDTSIEQLAIHCPNLTRLSLEGALISDASIQTLAQHYRHQLTSPTLKQCSGLTSAMLPALVHCSSSLTQLVITVHPSTKQDWITAATTSAMMMDVARLDQLTELSITGAPFSFTQCLLSTTVHPDTGQRVWPRLVDFTTNDEANTINDDQLIRFMQTHPELPLFFRQ
ncbi:unnamed protein product [Absidia cylindrospora]